MRRVSAAVVIVVFLSAWNVFADCQWTFPTANRITAGSTNSTPCAITALGQANAGPSALYLDNSDPTGYSVIRLNSGAGENAVGATLQMMGSNSPYDSQGGGTAGSNTAALVSFSSKGLVFSANHAAGYFRWMTGGWQDSYEKMRLTSDGKLGVGTIAPWVSLDVNGQSRTDAFGDALPITVRVADTRSYATSGAGMIFGGKYDTAGNATGYAVLSGIKENALASDYNGAIAFGTRSMTAPGGLNGMGERMRLTSDGRLLIGTSTDTSSSRLVVNGDVSVSGNLAAKYQDFAEWVPATEPMSAGTVVVVDEGSTNTVAPSAHQYDTSVAGVVSAQPGLILGVASSEKAMIATTGRVKVHVDASYLPIRAGDLLVTSDKPGVAMRSEPIDVGGVKIHRPGTLIGKALEPLASGEGEILVLLSLQ